MSEHSADYDAHTHADGVWCDDCPADVQIARLTETLNDLRARWPKPTVQTLWNVRGRTGLLMFGHGGTSEKSARITAEKSSQPTTLMRRTATHYAPRFTEWEPVDPTVIASERGESS